MKKAICILLVLVVCLSMTLTVFAEKDGQNATEQTEFVGSPGESGRPCVHGNKVTTGKKNPSCTENGFTGALICEDCGETVKPGKVIPKLEHKYDENGVCADCGTHYQPGTSDMNLIALWAVMILSAVGLVVVTTVYRKKV